jgi:hypothetical protein
MGVLLRAIAPPLAHADTDVAVAANAPAPSVRST